ncbi:MAG TPA: hypothetical protein VHF25_10125 [Nitriliruptorales bacterium]|nr:hypothetical protein [Nitriliruptorales bacterium]
MMARRHLLGAMQRLCDGRPTIDAVVEGATDATVLPLLEAACELQFDLQLGGSPAAGDARRLCWVLAHVSQDRRQEAQAAVRLIDELAAALAA